MHLEKYFGLTVICFVMELVGEVIRLLWELILQQVSKTVIKEFLKHLEILMPGRVKMPSFMTCAQTVHLKTLNFFPTFLLK